MTESQSIDDCRQIEEQRTLERAAGPNSTQSTDADVRDAITVEAKSEESDVDFDLLWKFVLAYCPSDSETSETASTGTLLLDDQAPDNRREVVVQADAIDKSPGTLIHYRGDSEETASTRTMFSRDEGDTAPAQTILEEAFGRKRRRSTSSASSVTITDQLYDRATSPCRENTCTKRRRTSAPTLIMSET